MELHLEACQVLQGGVSQAVSTQVQSSEVLQVELRSIQRAQLVVTQVDHLQVQSVKKTGRQFFKCISTQVQQLQGGQIPQVLAGAGINAVQQPQTVSVSTWQRCQSARKLEGRLTFSLSSHLQKGLELLRILRYE